MTGARRQHIVTTAMPNRNLSTDRRNRDATHHAITKIENIEIMSVTTLMIEIQIVSSWINRRVIVFSLTKSSLLLFRRPRRHGLRRALNGCTISLLLLSLTGDQKPGPPQRKHDQRYASHHQQRRDPIELLTTRRMSGLHNSTHLATPQCLPRRRLNGDQATMPTTKATTTTPAAHGKAGSEDQRLETADDGASVRTPLTMKR